MLNVITKTVLQRCANAFGFRVERILESAGTQIDVLELMVRLVLARQRNLFFVQIGANDGVTGDPLRPLIIRHRLPGILVEPQTAAFRRLVENYTGHNQLLFENVAIGQRNGTMTMYTPPAHLQMDILASFDRNVVRKHVPARVRIDEIMVEVLTLESLLTKHHVEHLDLLQIDAEGFDCDIIEMIDLNKVHPSIISFEHVHVSTSKYFACAERLSGHGYQLLRRGIDTLCMRSDILN